MGKERKTPNNKPVATNKMWKADGPEDKKIQNLIENGKVNKYTKPSTLQRDYPNIFGSFSPQVMRNHLNAAKRRSGLYCKYNN